MLLFSYYVVVCYVGTLDTTGDGVRGIVQEGGQSPDQTQ